jgi:hypothetical protein
LLHAWNESTVGTLSGYVAYYEESPTAIGGTRLFWRCHCGRRVTALFCPRGNLNWPGHKPIFACRHCYGLPYGSQYESKHDRMWRRYFETLDEMCDPKTPLRRWARLAHQFDTQIQPEDQADHEHFMARSWKLLAPPPTVKLPRGRPSKRTLRAMERLQSGWQPRKPTGRPPGRPREKRQYVRRNPFVLNAERKDSMQAYCPKCRDRRELADGRPVTFRNGRPALQGRCAECGTRTARIIQSRKPSWDR